MTREPISPLPAFAVGLLSLALLSAAAPARTEPPAAPAPAVPQAADPDVKPFADVPLSHPEYAAARHLDAEYGIPFRLPDGFSGRRALTAYEFAVAAERMHFELRWLSENLGAPDRVVEQRGGEDAEKLLATFAEPERLRRALGWYRPLLVEFGPVLKMLGHPPTERIADTLRWADAADKLAPAARKLLPAQPVPEPAQPGQPKSNVAAVFADVPLSHPGYAAVQYLGMECGLFTGYPDNTFAGKRALTRYEFAIALQRMLSEVQRMEEMLIRTAPRPGFAGQPRALLATQEPTLVRIVFRGPPGVPAFGEERRRYEALTSLPRFRSMLTWLSALTAEFHPELTMLGAEVEQARKRLARLDDEAPLLVQRAQERLRPAP